jgi:hypothetical protein
MQVLKIVKSSRFESFYIVKKKNLNCLKVLLDILFIK